MGVKERGEIGVETLTMAAMSKWKLGGVRCVANSDAAQPSETLAGRRADVYHAIL
jgi:hypothetical protein